MLIPKLRSSICAVLSVLLSLFVCNSATAASGSYKPLKQFGDGFRMMADRESQITLAVGVTSFFGARLLDDEAEKYFNKRTRIGNLSKLGNEFLGTGTPGVLLGGAFWVFGSLKDKPYALHAGQAQIETLIATTVIVSALKEGFGRERPNGLTNDSLPSAHTAYVFATGAVLNEFYGWKIGAPIFALGALTAAGRMQDDRHWLSDTVAGAAVAVLIGRAFARSHLKQLEAEDGKVSNFTVQPVVSPNQTGVALHFEF